MLVVKKALLILLCIFLLTGCGMPQDRRIPEGYILAQEFRDPQGGQDYTDFCIYVYESDEGFRCDPHYRRMTQADTETAAYFAADFRNWMELEGRLEEFTFDESCISTGDFYFLRADEEHPTWDYTLFYLDTESLTLYYMHTNL